MSKEALKQAINAVGGQTELVSKLKERDPDKYKNLRQGHVSNWLHRNKEPMPPPETVLDIEAVANVSRHELRDDIYPADTGAAA